MNQSFNFNVLLDLESLEPYLNTIFYIIITKKIYIYILYFGPVWDKYSDIWIYLDKYVHSPKYLLIFSKANLFWYAFVIYLSWQIYSDIHSSMIYGNEYIQIFIWSQNCSKWFKMVQNGPIWSKICHKLIKMVQMVKIFQNRWGQIFWYLNIFKYILANIFIR